MFFFRKSFLVGFVLLSIFPLVLDAQPKPKATKPKSAPSKNKTAATPKTKTNVTPAPKAAVKAVTNIIDTILLNNKNLFSDILLHPETHKVQIIYTQINRDKNNKASFVNHSFRLKKDDFFYAASMVKMPVCALALEKLEELKKTGITPNSIMITGADKPCQIATNADETACNGLPSIAQYIKRMMLVSDNTAYSRVFEFLTPEYIYKRLSSKGYPTARIRIRFDAGCLGKPNNYSNPITFQNDSGRILYKQPSKYFAADMLSMPVKNTIKFIDYNGPDISVKKDFSRSNYLALQDMHEIMKAILFPAETPPNKAFKMSPANRKLLWKYMQMMPYESDYPSYPDREAYFDSMKKYLFYGQDSAIILNKNIRIFNVVGQSYGYTTDCAYIVDFENNIEFMLTATYYIQNARGVIDGTDQTEKQIIMPFFKHLGQSVYQYELKRNRKFPPNLLEYKF